MGVPSAAVVYTGESGEMSGSGKGAAYSEDVSTTLENTNQWLKDIREDEKLKREEQRKKAEAWNSMLEETPDVWNLDFEKVKEKSLAYNDYVRSLREQGYNPYDLPAKESRELERRKAEVIRETNAAKANKEYWDKNTFNIDEDAGKTWNQEYATKWFEQYADPNLSPSERAKIRQQGKPYQKNVDLTDLVSTIGDTMEEQKLTQGGYDITGRDKEDFKKLLSIYFNDQSGMEDYEALMNSGKYKDDAELMKKAEEIFDALYKTSKVKRGGSGGGTKGGSGTEKETKPPVYAADKTSEPEYDQSIAKNKINVENRTPVYVTDKDGNKVANFVPGEFKIKPGGAVDVFGKGTNSQDTQVDIVIDYNLNKNEFLSKGYPNIFDLFRDANDLTSTSSTGGQKTLAERMREQNK